MTEEKPGPLEHLRRVTPRSESASGGEEYYEKRGLREQTGVLHYTPDGSVDLGKTLLENAWRNFDSLPKEQYSAMFVLANNLLKSRGEMTKAEALEHHRVFLDDFPKSKAENFALLLWASGIMSRYGVLSLEGTAAHFLQSSDAAMQLSRGKDEHQTILATFAAAWHDWRVEVDGWHKNAVLGARQTDNLRKAAPAATEKKQKSRAIIEKICRDYWLTHPRVSALQTSNTIEKRANEELQMQGLASYKSSTLQGIVKRLKREINPTRQ
jgi:hypothetical protein